MAVDADFCEANLSLLFDLLGRWSSTVEPAVRSNLVIAIGDLAFRFPNQLEPYTKLMYRSLSDVDTGVWLVEKGGGVRGRSVLVGSLNLSFPDGFCSYFLISAYG